MLSGTIRLITEFYEEIVLEQGDCVYLDSTVGHLCLAHGIEDAEVSLGMAIDETFGERRQSIVLVRGRLYLKRNILTLDVADFSHAL